MSGWEQRNAAFCKAQTDAGFAYIEAERRVNYHNLDGFDVPVMFCNWCKALVTFEGFEDYVTAESDGMTELRAAWNRRAE